MEELDKNVRREEIFSRAVRAGKRTYFFDVKATRSNEYYLTITESKRRFNNEQGKFYYEKHKLFLYKEDFEKFSNGLSEVIRFIETGEKPIEEVEIDTTTEISTKTQEEPIIGDIGTEHTDVAFEDLGTDAEESDS